MLRGGEEGHGIPKLGMVAKEDGGSAGDGDGDGSGMEHGINTTYVYVLHI